MSFDLSAKSFQFYLKADFSHNFLILIVIHDNNTNKFLHQSHWNATISLLKDDLFLSTCVFVNNCPFLVLNLWNNNNDDNNNFKSIKK